MKENNVVACIDRLRFLEASGKLSEVEREVVAVTRDALEKELELARVTDRLEKWRPLVKSVGQIALWLLIKHFTTHDENP